MSKKDIITIFVSALAGTFLLMWAIGDGESANGQPVGNSGQQEVVAVEVVQPVKKDIANHLSYLGTVAGEKDGNLSFRVPGMLNSTHVTEGQKVQKGQLLATLSAPELDAQAKRAESEFEKAKASRVFWEREVATDSTLFSEGAIARTVLNKTVFNYEQALNSFRAAKAALEEVRARKKLTRLEAPGDGRIGSIMVREGSNVAPHQPVIYLQQGDPLVYADVLEQDIQKGITIGSPVTAEPNRGNSITGKVERIDFQAKPPFRSVRVFVSFQDKAIGDRPSGTGVSLKFEVNPQDGALVVPVSAVDLRDGKPRLLRVNSEMEVVAVPVELGIQTGETRQVIGAVSQADRYISSGVNNVKPGDRVKIVREMSPNS